MASLGELGAFEEAHAVAEECLAIARGLDRPLALSFAWAAAGALALQRGQLSRAIEALDRALEPSRRGDLSPWAPRFAGALGYAHGLAGDAARGLRLLAQALDQAAAIGVGGGRSMLLAWLAEPLLLAGEAREALDTAEQAVALATRHGERGHAAWALRARAEAEARAGPDGPEGAARSYREAAALAGELEMRPLVAHCRLGLGLRYARTGERGRAQVELVAARQLFGGLGMELWLARVERALED